MKIGSSSVTTSQYKANEKVLHGLCEQVALARHDGHKVAIVTSGAIALGLGRLGFTDERPREMPLLQAASAVGQGSLISHYASMLGEFGLISGQVLLSASDFMERRQYLSAKSTISRMLDLGVVPVINENDAISDEEIRLGDNDRIAALVAGLIGADTLVLLTDQDGLFTADPRQFDDSTLIEQVQEVTRELASLAGGKGTNRGSGGMATKIVAARIAAWSGVETLITSATNTTAISDALLRKSGNGTWIARSKVRLPARKLWIAFALPAAGRILVDEGARHAIVKRGSSLLAVGVTKVEGQFDAGEAIEVYSNSGVVIAKGLSRVSAQDLARTVIARSGNTLSRDSTLVIHRDELIVLE